MRRKKGIGIFLWIVVVVSVFIMAGCKQVILRDPDVYWNEVKFFEMALKQNTELLKHYVQSGACSCDDTGEWSTPECKKSAGNIAVIEARLDWHVAQMEYLGKFQASPPPEEEPEIPDPSYLCPGGN